MFPQHYCALLKESFISGGLNWLLFKASLIFRQTVFFTAQPQKQALCDSAGVWLYSRNIHTSLLVPMLICQTAGVALLPVCSSNFFPIFLSHRLDWGWRRMLSRKTDRQAGRQASPGRVCQTVPVTVSSPAGFRPLRLQASLETSSLLPSLSRTLVMPVWLCSHWLHLMGCYWGVIGMNAK